MISAPDTAVPPSLLRLEDVAGNVTLAGGKAARLGELLAAGFSVPEGLVVTTAAFARHVPDAGPGRPTRPVMAPELRVALLAAVDELWGDALPPLAIRSSAVGEDGASASFAGLHATWYYVDRERLPEAVIDCWMSLWSPEALAYRRRLGLTDGFALGVIVQRMVRASRAGVVFTADPTGLRPGTTIVESVWGLGAALVDGRVAPDRFVLDREHAIVERRIARKRHKVDGHLDGESRERLQPVPAHLQTQASLTDDEVRALAATAASIAGRAGTDQDVEWAWENGALQILQARPLTARVPALPAADGEWVIFKPLIENFREPLTPMTVDLVERLMPPLVRFVDGRVYVRLDLVRALVPFEVSTAELVDLALLRRVHRKLEIDWRRLPLFGLVVGLAYLSWGPFWHRSAHVTPRALGRFRELVDRLLDNPHLDAESTLRRLFHGRHPWRPVGELMYQVNVSAGRYFLLLAALERLLPWAAPGFPAHRLGELCRGAQDMASRELIERLRTLASIARDHPAIAHTLTSRDPARLAGLLAELGPEHPFVVAFKDFLAVHGHRCARELELMSVRWREDPTPVFEMIRGYLDTPAPADGHGQWLAARDELRRCTLSPVRAWLFERLLDRARYYVTLRENSRHYHTMGFDAARRKLKRLEQELLYAGKLKCEDDLFFLTWDEARALADDRLGWRDVEGDVRTRRLHRQQAARQQPPETLNVHVERTAGAALTGECASIGLAEGVARVLFDPTRDGEFNSGEILVAPYTDPAWTPLFPRAAAIVVEVGSFLSHAGTLAREYGVPCLVDVHGCTERIRTGARVRVNATEGYLEILAP